MAISDCVLISRVPAWSPCPGKSIFEDRKVFDSREAFNRYYCNWQATYETLQERNEKMAVVHPGEYFNIRLDGEPVAPFPMPHQEKIMPDVRDRVRAAVEEAFKIEPKKKHPEPFQFTLDHMHQFKDLVALCKHPRVQFTTEGCSHQLLMIASLGTDTTIRRTFTSGDLNKKTISAMAIDCVKFLCGRELNVGDV